MTNSVNTRVLLVDDEEEFLALLAKRLETRNLKVSKAASGEDAIEIVNKQDFDVILLDLAMPGMDGLETLQKIKNDHPEADVIILTGHGTIQAGIEAMKLGADDFLEKPVDINVLMEKIKNSKEKHVLILQKQTKEEIKNILKSKGW